METTFAARGWGSRFRDRGPIASDPFVPAFWDKRRTNPELAKALSLVQRYVTEARDLLELDPDQAPLRTDEVERRFRDFLTRGVRKLSIDSAWELANQLKSELLFLGDVSYVWTELEYEVQRDKKPNKWHRWSDHFAPSKLEALIQARDIGLVDRQTHLEAVRSLRKLYELRAEAGMERRARAAQKCLYLTLLIPILFALQVALAAAIYEVGADGVWKQIVLAGSAGALGATLSGTLAVRDRLFALDDLRSFWPAMRIQPLIGATAGLFTLLALESHAIKPVGDEQIPWAAYALLTFVAGFSEPFFLGLVQKIAVIPDKDPADSAPTPAPS